MGCCEGRPVKPDGPITVPEDPAVLSAPLPFQLSHSIPCSAPLCVGMELGKRELLHECGQERCIMKHNVGGRKPSHRRIMRGHCMVPQYEWRRRCLRIILLTRGVRVGRSCGCHRWRRRRGESLRRRQRRERAAWVEALPCLPRLQVHQPCRSMLLTTTDDCTLSQMHFICCTHLYSHTRATPCCLQCMPGHASRSLFRQTCLLLR